MQKGETDPYRHPRRVKVLAVMVGGMFIGLGVLAAANGWPRLSALLYALSLVATATVFVRDEIKAKYSDGRVEAEEEAASEAPVAVATAR